jgi:dTDP-glucose 4,6-dehydratase
VILGEPLTVHGDGEAARDWLFVEDHCEALDALIHADLSEIRGQVINIGTERHRSVLEIAEAVLNAMGPCDSQIQFVGARPGQVFRHTADATKLKRLIDWEPKASFEEGLERTIRWYRDNEAWWRPQIWMRHMPIITAAGKREMH